MTDKTTNLRWVEHEPTFFSLMLGRIELAQINKGTASGSWFYSLRFCVPGERASFSEPTLDAAKEVAEQHAHKVLS